MVVISARVDSGIKEAFDALARARSVTTSRLIEALITGFIGRENSGSTPTAASTGLPAQAYPPEHAGAKTEMVHVRLEPYYYDELGQLAAQRRWYRSAYLANLLYAHVDRRPVLCHDEVNAVRQVARQLADIGRNVNQIASKANIDSDRADLSAFDFELIRMILDVETPVSPRLAEGSFTERECRFIAPCDVGVFIIKLVTLDALIFRPDLSPPGSFELNNGELSYYPSKAVYQMTAASSNLPRSIALTNIRQRDFSASPALAERWRDLATAECMRYLQDQSEMHNLPIDSELKLQLSSAIRVAAEFYSVAELWNMIWKVVRDAATLSRRDYYNPTKAAATLPGKIKRHLKKEKKGKVMLKPWDRPDGQPSETLGELFAEIFGIDEQTAGLKATDVLSPSVPSAGTGRAPDGNDGDRHHANALFIEHAPSLQESPARSQTGEAALNRILDHSRSRYRSHIF